MKKKQFLVFLSLFLLWMVLSGIFQYKYIIPGLVVSLVISMFSKPLFQVEHKGKAFYLLDVQFIPLIKYLIWLLGQIFLSTLDVTRAIIFSKKYAKPKLIYFKCPFENPMAIVMLTNSIILTPGTVTMEVTEDNVFCVHAITENAKKGIEEGTMMKKIGKLYGEL